MAYLFGDTRMAADRLELLADMFAPCSRKFLSHSAPDKLDLAVDLGCGVGHTTGMLASALNPKRTVGLDSSEAFIAQAIANAPDPSATFALHNVTEVPFPVGPCDVIFCRFLLSHQTNAPALVATWATQLAPGGRLLLEETESIHTDLEPFGRYIEIVTAMLADGGQTLCVGGDLHAMTPPAGTTRLPGEIGVTPATTDVAARLFAMNIRTWKHNRFIQAAYPADEIDDLQHRLEALAQTPTDRHEIEWRLRQVVFERDA